MFTSDWKIINDERYIWTYNFFSPSENAKEHMIYDMNPYSEWWNGSNDPKAYKHEYIILKKIN